MSDLAARTELRCAYLWEQLDEIQEQMAYPLHSSEYRRLSDRERQILRQIDEVDS
jgi:hypothetical protein